MNKEEIIRQARNKLTCANKSKYNVVVIPIFKPLCLDVSKNNIIPNRKSNMYEVYFEKYCKFIGDKPFWRFIQICES